MSKGRFDRLGEELRRFIRRLLVVGQQMSFVGHHVAEQRQVSGVDVRAVEGG